MDAKRLDHIPLFAGLDKRQRKFVAAHADEVDVPEGKELVKQGELAYEFFAIEDGKASVDVDGSDRGDLGPGDFFGEIGLLDSEHRRAASVTATTPMKLMVLTGHEFRAMGRDMPELAATVRAAMQRRLEGSAARR